MLRVAPGEPDRESSAATLASRDHRASRIPVACRGPAALLIVLTALIAPAQTASLNSPLPEAGPQAEPALASPRVGLVLGGGGARGFAHIGTLQMIDSLGIRVDCIVGTSMGGILGGLYATGSSGRDLEDLVRETRWAGLLSDAPPRRLMPYPRRRHSGRYPLELGLAERHLVTPSGILHGQNISLLFAELTFPYGAVRDFDCLPIPYRCVALDIVTGEELALAGGSLPRAMRATMAAPMLFTPVAWGDRLLVDGGVVNNLPVDVARGLGADIVIAVDVSAARRREELTSALEVLGQCIMVTDVKQRERNRQDADILISPDLAGFTLGDFDAHRVDAILDRGLRAAREAVPQLTVLRALQIEGEKTNVAPQAAASPLPAPRLRNVVVAGTEHLSSVFVRHRLALTPGEQLTPELMADRIRRLYALGYFAQVTYELLPAGGNEVDVRIRVEELPCQRLLVGLRYDTMHKFVAAVGVQVMNRGFSGLRLEGELQFIGLTRLGGRASYPSRSLDFPVYPFLDVVHENVPTDLFDPYGDRVASYKNRSTWAAAGLGITPWRWCHLEVAWQHEFLNMDARLKYDDEIPSLETEEELRQLRASLDIDTRDDVYLPRTGTHIWGLYERSDRGYGSAVDYELYGVSGDRFWSLADRQVLGVRAFWSHGTDVPVYKFFDQSGPLRFVGLKYGQMQGHRLAILRCEYRYQHREFLHFKLIANTAPRFRYHLGGREHRSIEAWGWGIGAVVDTPAGPLELIVSQGRLVFPEHREWETRADVVFGARF